MIELDSTMIAQVAGGEEPPPPSPQEQAEAWFEEQRWIDIIEDYISRYYI